MEIREFCGKIIIIIMWDISHMQEGNIMKKVLLFTTLLFVLHIETAFSARGGCTPIRCDVSKFNTKEMLTQDGVTGGVNNNDDGRFSSKLCYMCDTGGQNSQCNYNDIVVIANEGGQGIAFQCTDTRGANDTWVKVNESSLGVCGDSPLSKMDGYIANALISELRAGQTTSGSVSVNITQTGTYDSLCRYRRCLDGYTAFSGQFCVKAQSNDQPTPQPTPTQPNQPTTPTTTSICEARCKSLTGQQYVECTTCCKVPESIADWNGKNCVCADKSTIWDTDTQTCVPPTVSDEEEPEVGYTCPESIINTVNQWRSTYPQCVVQIDNLISYCNASNPNASQVNTLYTQIQQCISGVDADAAAAAAAELAASQAASLRRIESAVSKMNDIASGLKLTVWRNEEGKFNTSRLLSDSIAGVVLGTAGGLITSHVVKKNNIENGFEDIQCTIGGQVVAGWGDEFRVGIQ